MSMPFSENLLHLLFSDDLLHNLLFSEDLLHVLYSFLRIYYIIMFFSEDLLHVLFSENLLQHDLNHYKYLLFCSYAILYENYTLPTKLLTFILICTFSRTNGHERSVHTILLFHSHSNSLRYILHLLFWAL